MLTQKLRVAFISVAFVLSIMQALSVKAASKADKLMEQGNFLYYHGDVLAAINRFEKVLDYEPDNVNAHMSLVNLFIGLKKNDKAIEHARQAIQIKPDSINFHVLLGNLLKLENDRSGAIKAFEKAMTLGDLEPSDLIKLGYWYMDENQFEKSFSCFEKASRKNEVSLAARMGAIVAKYRMGRKQEAVSDLEKLRVESGDSASLLTTKGHLLVGMQEFEEAKKAYNDALKLDPENFTLYDSLARLELRKSNPAEAIRIYRDALSKVSEKAGVYSRLGDVYFNQGESKKAKDCFEQAIELDNNNVNAYYSLGVIHQKLGNIEEASKNFEYGANQDPDTKKKEMMMRHAMNLRLKSGLSISPGIKLEANHDASLSVQPHSTIFPVRYSDLVGLSGSRWQEMEQKIKAYKSKKSVQKKIEIPRMKVPRLP